MAENYLDEWFLSSVKNYSALHMYELHHPTQALAFCWDKSVLTACRLGDQKSELLQLQLPNKILLEGNRQDLCKDRDFKVKSGSLHNEPVGKIKILPSSKKEDGQSRLFACSELSKNCVSVWTLPTDDSDLMLKQFTLQNDSQNTLEMTNESYAKISIGDESTFFMAVVYQTYVWLILKFEIKRICSSIHHIDENTTLCSVADSPHVYIIDTRQRNQTKHLSFPSPKFKSFWACAYSNSGVNKGSILHASTQGDILCQDLRALNEYVFKSELEMEPTSFHMDRFKYFKIEISPTDAGTFSISGNGPNVIVYNHHHLHYTTPQATNSDVFSLVDNKHSVSPIFKHKGHLAESGHNEVDVWTTNHIWHPNISNLILSSATDGSLHAWKYIKKK